MNGASDTMLRLLLVVGALHGVVSGSVPQSSFYASRRGRAISSSPTIFGLLRSSHDHPSQTTTTTTTTETTSRTTSRCIKASCFHFSRLENFPHRNHCIETPRLVLLSLRGGSSEEEDEEESDEEESDDDVFATLEVEDVNEDDFDEDNMVDQWIQSFKDTPPLTKVYLTAAFVASALGAVLNKGEFPPIFSLDMKKVVTRLQLWRPVTAFLNLGSLGVFWLLTAQFVGQYMSSLETVLHKTPYDFWIMIAFGMASMVIGYPALKLSPRFLGHNLGSYLVYIWSRYHEGMEVNLFELFMVKAELLPWFFVAQTALLEGEVPTLDILGILFGFIYYYLKSIGVLRAPQWLVNWYKTSPSAKPIKDKYDDISSDFGGA
jgi:Derlin-2/3